MLTKWNENLQLEITRTDDSGEENKIYINSNNIEYLEVIYGNDMTSENPEDYTITSKYLTTMVENVNKDNFIDQYIDLVDEDKVPDPVVAYKSYKFIDQDYQIKEIKANEFSYCTLTFYNLHTGVAKIHCTLKDKAGNIYYPIELLLDEMN